MKVLHVIPSIEPNSGGPAEAIFPMCRALRAEGIDVFLITTDAGVEAEIKNTVVDHKGIPTVFFPSQWGDSFKFSRPMSAWLNDHVEDFDVVHIHAVFNHACVAAARACRKHGVPYVVRPLGTLAPWSMKQKRLRKQLFWQLEGNSMLRSAAAVHYTTRAEKEDSRIESSNEAVIPLATDSHVDDSIAESTYLPEQSENSPYVLVMSRLHPKKALDVLIPAFTSATADHRFQKWRLVIAGDGPADYLDVLRRKVDEANATDRIQFLGWLDGDSKWSVLKRASLLALPSYQENFGMCILEAMTFGVPVLVSPHVNLADSIKEAKAGWVSSVEVNALRRTLIEVFDNEAERARRGLAAQLLSKRFTWEKTAKDLVQLYSSITTVDSNVCIARKAVDAR